MPTVQPAQLCHSEHSCLLVVDLQERLTAAIPSKVITRLRNNTAILLAAAKQLTIPVIATAQYPKGLGAIEAAIVAKLPDTARCFEKTCFSCLGTKGLKELLVILKKKQIIMVGIEAHICILQSAFDLMTAGYDVFVVADAIASRKLANYEVAIVRLNQAGTSMINTESVLFEWLRDAAHVHFKSLSKLIL